MYKVFGIYLWIFISIQLLFKINNIFIQDLIYDLDGQLKLGLSTRTFYNKWGKLFIPSYIDAITYLYCNNFKDKAVQHFGGKLFNKIRDTTDNK